MAYPLVINAKSTGAINGGTTASIDTTGATFLVLVASYLSGGSITISDNKSNTWTALTLKGNAGSGETRIYYVNSATPTVGSGHTFTIGGTGIYGAVYVSAFSGITATPFDVENGNTKTTGSPITTGSITPSQNNSIIIAGVVTDNATPSAIDSGFTITDSQALVGGTTYGGASAYLIQDTASAVNASWTCPSSINLAAVIASFKVSGILIDRATIDSPGNTNCDSTQLVGQCFQVQNTATLDSLTIPIKKSGTTSGSFHFLIYALSGTYGSTSIPTGSILATSDAIDSTTITTAYVNTKVLFSGANRITLTSGQQYAITCDYAATAYPTAYLLMQNKTPSFHGGNQVYYSASTWNALSTYDMVFDLRGVSVTLGSSNFFMLM